MVSRVDMLRCGPINHSHLSLCKNLINYICFFTFYFLLKLTFLNVLHRHNAGHEVPAYAPAAAYTLWKLFLDGFWTCDNNVGSNICGAAVGSTTINSSS